LTTVVLLVCLVLTAFAVLARRRHLRLKAACEAAFARCYGATARPSFEMSYSYGEPAFLVQFASRQDAAAAADANNAFLREIGELCKDRGRKRQFKAERAVFFRYPVDPDEARAVQCCARMQAQVDLGPSASIVHPAPHDYRLRAHERGTSAVAIDFCPWCGTALGTAGDEPGRERP
jgi:hypothetical protein